MGSFHVCLRGESGKVLARHQVTFRQQHQEGTEKQKTLNIDMRIYRPVLAGLCSLNELRTVYTLDDLYDFHELLDLKQEAEYLASTKKVK